MKKFFVLLVVSVVVAVSCTNDKKDETTDQTAECGTITTTFSANVSPLIASSCAKSGCHAAGSSNGPGALTTYTQIYNNRVAIRSAVAGGSMPQDATFNATQKATITCWIDGGAANN
jgi:hypothetical protein